MWGFVLPNFTGRIGVRSGQRIALACLLLSVFLISSCSFLLGQNSDTEKPVPILTGNAGAFDFVSGGHTLIDTQVNPVLLVPLGERWLIESRAEFEGQFQRPSNGGPFGGPVDKHLDYAQIDYIANPYLTITAGRFLTPFGVFNERLYPVWIRALQPDPLIYPISTAPSDGVMFRGGFAVNPKASLNYAAYVSVASIGIDCVDSERHVGGRLAFFFPASRVEVGGSWQRTLQDARKNAFGFHMGWQPSKVPLNLRSEFAHSFDGSGYWVEGTYRLSQVHFWSKAMRRTEIVSRMQQFYAGEISPDGAASLGLPSADTREADFGVNYFLRDGLKGIASYGRQFSSAGNFNQWSLGIAYRWMIPLGRVGAP
jgi:hypothetical protein